jgi:hypothetical protein
MPFSDKKLTSAKRMPAWLRMRGRLLQER